MDQIFDNRLAEAGKTREDFENEHKVNVAEDISDIRNFFGNIR